MKYVRIENLQPGQITASGLYDTKNRLMLAPNTILTGTMIERMGILEFAGIYVLHDSNDENYRPLLNDETRQEAIRAQKDLDVDQIRYIANNILNQVLYGSDRLYDMMNVCAYDDMTYMHSVNVTVLSIMTGVAMGLGNDDLTKLGQAALLHDVGKTRVDPAIIKKPGRLTDEEFAQVKMHPVYGYRILDENPAISEDIKQAVLSHHENENGTGYPNQISGNQISIFAKIIHVADVYEAMVSKRHYKDRMNPADVLEHLMGSAGVLFDLDCVNALTRSVAIYPNGVHVKLSNRLTAWVQENHKGYPTRPVVMTDDGLRIDLMKALNVTITGILEG